MEEKESSPLQHDQEWHEIKINFLMPGNKEMKATKAGGELTRKRSGDEERFRWGSTASLREGAPSNSTAPPRIQNYKKIE